MHRAPGGFDRDRPPQPIERQPLRQRLSLSGLAIEQHRIAIGPDQEIEQRLALRGQQRRPARCIGIEGGDVAGDEALEESAHILAGKADRSEEHTSELQSLMRISYAVFCLKKKKKK